MNEPKPNAEDIDDVVLDRLVDGELSPAEYRRVLLSLEQQPAAWRKCAQAFLQAQAWRAEMNSVRAAAEIKPVAPPQAEPAPQKNIAGDWLRMFLVAAASFLAAYFVVQQSWKVVERTQPANNVPIAKAPVEPTAPTQAAAHNNQPLGKVQLAVNRNGSEEPQMMDVAVYDPETATEIYKSSRPALPDDLLQALTAEGHRIDRQPRLMPIQLDDGRQMMVPVEGYRIVPVNRPSY
ncbi:anti-sigma factor family protein [Anatilimnocola floriformis]|uniref:anti-sigma factor family protein n=1 Tax=Anatilimnocola floriformis TaxID=2948575 RepID=UPI0020C4A9E7|nr:hypothetical protein [Anatilimnocola floriformis]